MVRPTPPCGTGGVVPAPDRRPPPGWCGGPGRLNPSPAYANAVKRKINVEALLAEAAIAACGPIVFIGLVLPHLARFLCGPGYRWILPYSMLLAST